MTPDNVLRFWFPEQAQNLAELEANSARWFNGGQELDREIARRFVPAIDRAEKGDFNHWKHSPRGRLALIVLLDQFTRNAFRGRAKAYSLDKVAIAVCLEGLESGADSGLAPVEQLFFYLPLLHSESLVHQDMSVRCMEALLARVSGHERQYFMDWTRVARRQRAIIRRFGRFPHRNDILSRKSTPGEMLLRARNKVGAWVIRLRRLARISPMLT